MTTGVSSIEEGSADDIPGVDSPDVAVLNEPTGVDMGVLHVLGKHLRNMSQACKVTSMRLHWLR